MVSHPLSGYPGFVLLLWQDSKRQQNYIHKGIGILYSERGYGNLHKVFLAEESHETSLYFCVEELDFTF